MAFRPSPWPPLRDRVTTYGILLLTHHGWAACLGWHEEWPGHPILTFSLLAGRRWPEQYYIRGKPLCVMKCL